MRKERKRERQTDKEIRTILGRSQSCRKDTEAEAEKKMILSNTRFIFKKKKLWVSLLLSSRTKTKSKV